MEPKIPKKRGRKPKCAIDSLSKISGYLPMRDSIDTKNNELIFTNPNKTPNVDIDEQVSFGNFNIGIKNIIIPDIKNISEKLKKNSNPNPNLCNIDIPDYEDNSDDENENIKKNQNIKKKQNIKKNQINQINPELDLTFILQQFKGKQNKQIDWPTDTNVCCWWCCHTFKGSPKPLPTHHDILRNRFKVTGVFCSWPCVKAYAKNDNTLLKNFPISNLTSMIMQIYQGKILNIPTAPPRQMLKMFGGKMNINDFRNIYPDETFEMRSVTTVLDCNIYIERKRKKKYS